MALSKLNNDSFADTAVHGRRNLIINGAMQVAQRGTSSTGITAGGYRTCDRFRFSPSSAGTWTVTQSTEAPDGFANSFKADCTTADASLSAGDFLILEQKIEGQNLQNLKKGTASAESLTLSFWVKSSKTGTYICELDDNDNGRNINKSYTISAADTWEHKSLTFDGDTSGTLDNDSNDSFRVFFWLAAGSTYTSGTLATSWESTTNANRAVGQVNLADNTSNDWYVTGVQLEVGDKATPFEHRSFGEELRLCQRYYEDSTGNQYTFSAGSAGFGGNSYFNSVDFKVTKRAAPTITIEDASGNSGKMTVYQGATGYDNQSVFYETTRANAFAPRTGGGRTDAGLGRAIWSADAEL